jgi:light-regulated signal transduction histidine kinase (bacteriophytochrome)
MYLPRLTARNAAEARAQLRDRRARLLSAAADMLDRAELFVRTAPPVADDLIAEGRALLAQAERIQL